MISLVWYKYKSSPDPLHEFSLRLHQIVRCEHHRLFSITKNYSRLNHNFAFNTRNDEGAYATCILFLTKYIDQCREGPFLARLLQYLAYESPPDFQKVPDNIRNLGGICGTFGVRSIPEFFDTVCDATIVLELEALHEEKMKKLEQISNETAMHKQTIELLQKFGYKPDEIEFILRCVTGLNYGATENGKASKRMLVAAIEHENQIPVAALRDRLRADIKGLRDATARNKTTSVQPVPSAPPLETIGTSTNVCDICMTDPKNTVILPCKHTCCSGCVEKIKECHICRGPIESRMRIFV